MGVFYTKVLDKWVTHRNCRDKYDGRYLDDLKSHSGVPTIFYFHIELKFDAKS